MPSTGSTTERDYGYQHRKIRAAELAKLRANPGQPCPRCGGEMYPDQDLDLDHTDDRTAYRGLAHTQCNRSAGGRRSAEVRARKRANRSAWRVSRQW